MRDLPISAKIQSEVEEASRENEAKRRRWVQAIRAVKDEIAGSTLNMDEIKGMFAKKLKITKEQFRSGMIYLLSYTSFAELLKYFDIPFKENSRKETKSTFTIEDIEQWFTNFFKNEHHKPRKNEINEAIEKGELPARESVPKIKKGESLAKILKCINAKWQVGDL